VQSVSYFCPILNVLGISGGIFVKVYSIKSHGSPSSGIRADTYGQTEGCDDDVGRFSQFCEGT
jgi:hypothetical protein